MAANVAHNFISQFDARHNVIMCILIIILYTYIDVWRIKVNEMNERKKKKKKKR